jgi:uncharacterized protein DUF4124
MMLATISRRGIGMHARTFKRCGIFGIGLVLACGALAACTRVAQAESVYKCRASDGAIAFQDRPCADARSESVVEILPAPLPSPPPDHGRAPREARVGRTHGASSARAGTRPSRDAVSYACHASNGELFYRHGACPKQIPARSASGGGPRGRAGKTTQSVGVTAQALPRSEVCRKLASAGSIGRAGHEHDESMSTYDRNLGRDPCRYL